MSDVLALIPRRTTVALLVLAPACEVLEALLSPLKGTGTAADLAAVQAHQGLFVASVLVGLLGTTLYLPAYIGLAGLTASRSPRLAVAGALLCGASMLCFGGIRMVSAVELQSVREPLATGRAAGLLDGLTTNPLMLSVLVVFLGAMALGYPLLAASCWRAGLPRAACAAVGVLPFVAFFVDDAHWGNVATHLLLLGSLGWIAWSLQAGPDGGLSVRRLLPTRVVVVLLVVAPVLEVLEQLLSPLASSSTRADVEAIAGHQAAFVASVLVGAMATMLYVPAFGGLAARCLGAAPRAARVGAAAAAVSMTGFMGVRALQAVELQGARSGFPTATTTHLVDHVISTPVGAVVLVMFLGGSVVGLVGLAVATWCQGLTRVGTVLLAVFPVVDLLVPTHAGTIASHALLLVALTWLARDLAQSPRSGAADRAAVAQPV